MCCSSILLETFPLHNGGLFPLCNSGSLLPCESSLCYLMSPYTSPPSPLLLSPTQIHKTMLSVSIQRPPPEPPPNVQQISCLGSPDLLPRLTTIPTTTNTHITSSITDLTPSERPPPEPPPSSSTSMNVFVLPDPDLCRLPPKPPWLICSLVYFVLFVLCLCVCVFVVDFTLYVCSIVLCVLCSGLVIKSVSQLILDATKHISCVVIYEDAPHFNTFAFYQLIFVQHDKVNKSETKFSRNARDEAKKMIRNWIGKKTLDSHISFVGIRRWKLLMNGLSGNVISFMVFLAPMTTFYRIYKKKSTEGFQSLPYLVALFSSMLWLYYAFLKKDEFLLITINSFGCVVELIYIILYITYATKDARKLTIKLLLAMNIGSFGLILLVTKYAVHGPVRVQVLGWICVSISVSVFAAPLTIVAQVVRTKSVEFMPFNLSFTLTLSAIMWFGYGLFLKDICIALPNVLGFALGLVQMILYCIYRNGDKKKGNAKAAPLDPLKSVVIESSLGGTGEVFEVKKNDGEEGNKSKEEEEEEEEEKKKSIEETDEYDCKV